MRRVSLALVTLGFAAAVHFDWHTARPTTHHLSLGWSWHWLVAVPVGALTAWYVRRVWADRRAFAGVVILGAGAFLGGVVEPAWEYCFEGATREWAFGAIRNIAFASFVATAITAHAVTLLLLRRAPAGQLADR